MVLVLYLKTLHFISYEIVPLYVGAYSYVLYSVADEHTNSAAPQPYDCSYCMLTDVPCLQWVLFGKCLLKNCVET